MEKTEQTAQGVKTEVETYNRDKIPSIGSHLAWDQTFANPFMSSGGTSKIETSKAKLKNMIIKNKEPREAKLEEFVQSLHKKDKAMQKKTAKQVDAMGALWTTAIAKANAKVQGVWNVHTEAY